MQQLTDLKLHQSPTKSENVSKFKGSQLVGDANRIILRAKTDSIILDSPNRITLGAPELRIGKENAEHPLVKGDILRMILNDLINTMGSKRRISVSRELTKIYEETIRGELAEILDYFNNKKLKGEFVIVIEGNK